MVNSKPTRQSAEPLKTRHVFFDTEVYRRAGFNVRNSQFTALKEYVEAGRISVHMTDITSAEVHRQIGEEVADKAGRLEKVSHSFRRFSQLTTDCPELPEIDKEALTQAIWRGFLDVVVSELSADNILAMQVSPRKIFEKYFAGAPPFSKRGSKEFPDAFVTEALADYCAKHQLKMYVVSGDIAFREAAAAHPSLIPLVTINELLASCVAEVDIDLEPIVDAIFSHPAFDDQLINALNEDVPYLDGVYFGTLDDGEVRDITLDEVMAVDGYSLAAIDTDTISLIVDVPCVLGATVDYMYFERDYTDEGPDYATAAAEHVTQHNTLKLYLRIDTDTGHFKETELLTKRAYFD
ncbi:hypothetical protein ELI25_03955 [Rhizobium ruizarguesonis]|uniref:PIN domain-containing protein n=1 Tax=Rhizobium ruizarguesonis TaxID=2081791 RepID=UPI001030D5EE|nr:PIN domain-containing protein [Rhizobium ruizarguesonis]TAW15060.1 hypothetical protein ELI25_03955 [Rhizobium ruizarguesonis]